MKYYIVILILFILFVPLKTDLSAGSIDTTNLIAYPNPFNPQKNTGVVLIGYFPGTTITYDVNILIYNVNGDLVNSLSGSSLTGTSSVTWNGRNARGTLVYPGLYILRVKLDDTSNGDSAVKILRLLVNH